VFDLESFFQKNANSLEQSYPGINLNILKRHAGDASHVIWNRPLERKLLEGVPLEYIFKQSFFWDSFFYVDKRVLIPRMESEQLVEYSLSFLKDGDHICEIGVGSGALILSIACERKKLKCVATDISKSALEVAKTNTYRMSYRLKSHDIKFIQTDRLKGIEGQFRVIVTNPPYIKKRDRGHVHERVHEHEPHVALYLEDDKYDQWFTELFDQAYNCLKDTGVFLMEGHEFHLDDLRKKCMASGFSQVEIKDDLTKRKRFLIARK